MHQEHIVIVGGGVIGSAIACFLALHPRFAGSVTVIERDSSYELASSALSAGSIRQQFSTPINIAMSQFGIDFLRDLHSLAIDNIAPDVGLHEGGYLYLARASGAAILRENHATQLAHGVDVRLLEPADLQKKFPWMSTQDLALASFGQSGEGWFDGYGLMMAFRRKARSLGVEYLNTLAQGFSHQANRVNAVRLHDGTLFPCDWAINAAGAWARPLMQGTGFDLPVVGRKRCVFSFSSPALTPQCPLIIDPSGMWLRPEGRGWICGLPPEHDPDNPALEVEHELFDKIWTILADRVPGFAAARVQSAWAGYYDYNTFDQNGIVGPHPQLSNLLLANGFSGHGLQHAPAVGRALTEWIVDGAYTSLDLSALSAQRLVENRPLLEKNVI
ncbi:MAG: FAD-dependent oxidoreductase [Pseudomonadota bacterium]